MVWCVLQALAALLPCCHFWWPHPAINRFMGQMMGPSKSEAEGWIGFYRRRQRGQAGARDRSDVLVT